MLKLIALGATLTLLTAQALIAQSAKLSSAEVLLEAVVASVNGKPITLLDLTQRLNPPRKLSLKEASLDPEARTVLDTMILERLITEEAEAKKVRTGDSEVESYLDEIAKRNSLSREEFEQALKKEGMTLAQYRERVRIDILRSKLASNFASSGIGVSDEEVESYIKEHPELAKSGTKLKLRQILVRTDGRTSEEARSRVEEVQKKIEDGQDFAKLAAEYSDSPDGAEGGSLGVVNEGDLSPQIFDAVFSLKQNQISQVVETQAGFHLFKLEERYQEEENKDELLKDEVRKTLQDRKLQEKVELYFTTDLPKLHSVDKKI